MPNNKNELADALIAKRKKKIKINGKEYDLSQFDDTKSWSKRKNK